MVLSALNWNFVPFRSVVFAILWSLMSSPLSNSATFVSPSRNDSTLKKEESALTAFVPTPFNPTDF